MYPFIRMTKEIIRHRKAPSLPITGTHVTRLTCWPWDIDMWAELNNGRSLTLYDLGRIPLAVRTGLVAALRRRGWGMTMAGATVRWRRRVKTFETVEMLSRVAGWDDRFIYLDQSMWKKNGDCASQAVYRSAITGPGGIVPPAEIAAELGVDPAPPEMPAWLRDWIAHEAGRPWPPARG